MHHCNHLVPRQGSFDGENGDCPIAYDLTTGRFEGLLQDASGKPLAINGIWSLSVGNVSPNNRDRAAEPAAQVYFTAGPNQQSQGLFGLLTAVQPN